MICGQCVYRGRGVTLAFLSLGYVSLALFSASMSVMNLVASEPPATKTDLVAPTNCIIDESDSSSNFCN